eukprot:2632519-Rhodomonas_salina.1
MGAVAAEHASHSTRFQHRRQPAASRHTRENTWRRLEEQRWGAWVHARLVLAPESSASAGEAARRRERDQDRQRLVVLVRPELAACGVHVHRRLPPRELQLGGHVHRGQARAVRRKESGRHSGQLLVDDREHPLEDRLCSAVGLIRQRVRA